jgi:hypothetical protein
MINGTNARSGCLKCKAQAIAYEIGKVEVDRPPSSASGLLLEPAQHAARILPQGLFTPLNKSTK